MTIVDDVLWFVKDGKWHNTEKIKEEMGISKTKTEIVLEFLNEYNFIQLNKEHTKAKIQKSTRNFIIEILKLEEEKHLNE